MQLLSGQSLTNGSPEEVEVVADEGLETLETLDTNPKARNWGGICEVIKIPLSSQVLLWSLSSWWRRPPLGREPCFSHLLGLPRAEESVAGAAPRPPAGTRRRRLRWQRWQLSALELVCSVRSWRVMKNEYLERQRGGKTLWPASRREPKCWGFNTRVWGRQEHSGNPMQQQHFHCKLLLVLFIRIIFYVQSQLPLYEGTLVKASRSR